MLLDPISLQVFISAVEEGTIAKAAARERIAPAAISRRLSELEAVLQTPLFTRSNKGLQPTTAGLTLISLARQVLHDIDDVYAHMREFTGGTRGYIRVFANLSSITQFLPNDLQTFLTLHPDVQISLEERVSTAITKGVAENAADIGLFTQGVPSHGLKIFPYHKDELVVVIPKKHTLAVRKSVSVKDILDYDFVGLHAGSWMNLELTKAATALGRTLRQRIQVTGYDALCLMVEAGMGIGILPKNSARPYTRSLRLKTIPLNEPWSRRQLAICVRSYEHLSVAAKLLVDHFQLSSAKDSK
jgi:DNA-binding transcriptional LysR family regulator